MSFHELLERLRRICRWSMLTAIVFFAAPIAWLVASMRLYGNGGGMHGLGTPVLDPDWPLRLIVMGQLACLASAFFAAATAATYLIGKKLPDYSEIVTGP